METIKLDISKTGIAVSAEMQAKAQTANALLESGKGAGNDFLGWVHLPSSISAAEIEAIEKQAAKLREKAEVIICIGIGGSYLGAKAVLEAMSDRSDSCTRSRRLLWCSSQARIFRKTTPTNCSKP